jgi:hypothetical protein
MAEKRFPLLGLDGKPLPKDRRYMADLNRRLVTKSQHAKEKGIGVCQCADCLSIESPHG